MKWLFIVLFIFGCFFMMSGYGAKESGQKKIYYGIGIFIWIVILILANTIL